jgi:hypothetical protein
VNERILGDPENTNSAIFKTGGGCFPIMNMTHERASRHCNTLAADALRLARDLPQVESVVMAALWNKYLKEGENNTTRNIAPGTPDYQDALRQLSNYLKTLVTMKKKVWLILTIPTGEKLSPAYVVERVLKNFPRVFHLREQGGWRRERWPRLRPDSHRPCPRRPRGGRDRDRSGGIPVR